MVVLRCGADVIAGGSNRPDRSRLRRPDANILSTIRFTGRRRRLAAPNVTAIADKTAGLVAASAAATIFGINNSWFAFGATSAGVNSAVLVAGGAIATMLTALIAVRSSRLRLTIINADRLWSACFCIATAGTTLAYLRSFDTSTDDHISSSVAVVVLYTYPLLILIVTHRMGHQSRRSLLWLMLLFALAIFGVGRLMCADPTGCGTISTTGMLLAAFASVASAAQVIFGNLAKNVPALTLAFWSQLVTLIGATLVVAMSGGSNPLLVPSLGSWHWIAAFSFCTAAGAWLQIQGIRRAPPSVVGFVFMLEPISTMLTAIVTQGEAWNSSRLVGSTMMLAAALGAILIMRGDQTTKVTTAAP